MSYLVLGRKKVISQLYYYYYYYHICCYYCYYFYCWYCFCYYYPRSGELRTQKLKSHLVRTQSLYVLPLKPGVGQYIAIHAYCQRFLPRLFLSFRSIHLHFYKTSLDLYCVGCG